MSKEISYEQIKNYIEIESGSGCILIMTEKEFEEEKIKQVKSNTKVKLKILCGICRQEIIERCYNDFSNKSKPQQKCNKCSRLSDIFQMQCKYNNMKNYIEIESKSGCSLVTTESEFIEERNKQNKTPTLVKVKIMCSDCKEEYFVSSFTNFKSNKKYNCDKCSKKNFIPHNKKHHEQFCNDIYGKYGEEYTIKGIYENCYTKINVIHNKCGYDWDITPMDILGGHGCPKCAGNIVKTNDDFKEDICELVGNEYTVLGEYINNNTKILMKHNMCNYEWSITPNGFLSGNRCPKCGGKIKDKTTTYFKKEVFELVGNEYEVVGEYISALDYIEMKHNDNCCKSPNFITKPNWFLTGRKCPQCFGTHNKTDEEFKKEIYELVGNEYDILGEYINCETKVLIKHNNCGHEWKVIPNNFTRGTRCPCCNQSKGEARIDKWLIDNNFIVNKDYVPQKQFDNLLGLKGGSLSYDFYLINCNLLIEYQGEYHDGTVSNQTKEEFEKQIEHDRLKQEYALENNIDFLPIWYWDYDNIEEILDKELNILK